MIVIGIDTGVDTGYAVYNTDLGKFTSIGSEKIHYALSRVRNILTIKSLAGDDEKEKVIILVEDARKRGCVPEAKNVLALGAGSVRRDARIWEDFLTDEKATFKMVAPRNTKMSASDFKEMTGWEGRTNEHSRDAASVVLNWLEDQKKRKLIGFPHVAEMI